MMPYVSEMSVGELFDRTLKILGKTIGRNVIIGLVVFVPATLAMIFALDHFIHAVIGIFKQTGFSNPDPMSVLRALIMPGVLLGIAVLLLSIGNVLAQLSMMSVAGAEMVGDSVDWIESIGEMAKLPLWRAIGASLLQGVVLSAVFIVPMLVIVTGVKLLAVIGVFALLGGIAFAIYLAVCWVVILPVLAVEQDTVLHAFTRSRYLVKEYWWRTLGVLILFSMASQLAISLISTPLSFAMMWGFWSKYFSMFAKPEMPTSDPTPYLDMFSNIGISYAAIIGVTMLLTALIHSVYMVVVYFDLRARKGEFRNTSSETPSAFPTPDMPGSVTDLNSIFPQGPDIL
jgi:hypothetical protein